MCSLCFPAHNARKNATVRVCLKMLQIVGDYISPVVTVGMGNCSLSCCRRRGFMVEIGEDRKFHVENTVEGGYRHIKRT